MGFSLGKSQSYILYKKYSFYIRAAINAPWPCRPPATVSKSQVAIPGNCAMSPAVKAIVLLELIQKRYLEDHIRDPGRYFPLLRRKKILSQAECSSIKKHEYQIQKFVELISLKEGGYDVFVEALKSLRVNAHVAAHLKRRVLEVDKLYSQGESE